MFYNAIYIFFAGAVLTKTFSLDYISATLFFFVFVFLYQTFSKTYLYDNLKDTKFSLGNFVSFILYFVFTVERGCYLMVACVGFCVYIVKYSGFCID
jgi:hypothetical protein